MTNKDFYEVLGVPRDADEKAIKAAYRKLARQYHPDLNQGDQGAEQKFKEVSEAFAVLSDPEKRAKYDRGGAQAFGPDFNPFQGMGFDFRTAGGGAQGFPDLSELFEAFGMGGGAGMGGRGRPRAQKGQSLELEVEVAFADAVKGATLQMQVPRRVWRGGGFQRVEERIKVRVPAGIGDGGKVRLAGKGDEGMGGGPAGDVFLVVRVTPDSTFRREGQNLVVDVPVGFATAALGGQADVPTLDGSAKINIPAGTASGQRFRLKGRGVPGRNGSAAGDLLAVLQIAPPKDLDPKSRELIEEFAKLNPGP
ncbi:hypothetical protein ABI59_21165 [Acidobacteria bacterium Mor1]|nr:hypothetical protein ABI59_21165 [Acidobacteria bacterium Mor1]